MNRPHKPRRNVQRNRCPDILSFLRDRERRALQASTPSGRQDLKMWQASLQKNLTQHEELVRTSREALDLIGAALGEVPA